MVPGEISTRDFEFYDGNFSLKMVFIDFINYNNYY